MNYLLKAIYGKVYDEDFAYGNFDDRKKLQKAVYLLENMGVDIGDYSFVWDSYGPYSLGLDCEASQLDDRCTQEFTFSKFAEECFGRLRDILEQNGKYSCVAWMECIASLHYLKNVFRFGKDDVVKELMKRKPHLLDEEANYRALEIVNTIRVGV
ncbi:hypothetical protein ACTQ33_16540 [Candidatus Avoscillospira sp. LCP25S3_F1]|uniref:hypothetical protein n=1 Tax=Candidatus Avoscillospira sp. LCP25S3_F1 TaxID=3438825 RepID=UPI003F938E39